MSKKEDPLASVRASSFGTSSSESESLVSVMSSTKSSRERRAQLPPLDALPPFHKSALKPHWAKKLTINQLLNGTWAFNYLPSAWGRPKEPKAKSARKVNETNAMTTFKVLGDVIIFPQIFMD